MNEIMRDSEGLSESEFLHRYNPNAYKKPSFAVDNVVFTVADEEAESYRKLPNKVLKVALVRRGGHPYINKWALPGGFIKENESIDEAAQRELREETNIRDVYLEQLFTWGSLYRDPRDRVISCSYLSLIDSTQLEIMAGDDATEARWFTLQERVVKEEKVQTDAGYSIKQWITLNLVNGETLLTPTVLIIKEVEGKVRKVEREIFCRQETAFDHAVIIQYGLERLRNKLEYTAIAFSLMPDLFTLTELQKAYEVILNTELLAANFRRKITPMVIETNQYRRESGHRPAKLFRFNSNWSRHEF